MEPPLEKGGPEVTTEYSVDFIVSIRNLVGFRDLNGISLTNMVMIIEPDSCLIKSLSDG